MKENRTKEIRTKEIKIRLTETEHKSLLMLAGTQPLAEWMRENSLDIDCGNIEKKLHKQRARLEQKKRQLENLTVDPELLRALSGIGNNINQIARKLNQVSSGGISLAEIAIRLETISKTLGEVREDHRQGDLLNDG